MASKEPKPGDEVTTYHEHGPVHKKKKHKIVSVHYGPYYGFHGGGFAPNSAMQVEPEQEDEAPGSPEAQAEGESETPDDTNLWLDSIVNMIGRFKK